MHAFLPLSLTRREGRPISRPLHAGSIPARSTGRPWRNWQTRTVQVRVPKGVVDRLHSGAPYSEGPAVRRAARLPLCTARLAPTDRQKVERLIEARGAARPAASETARLIEDGPAVLTGLADDAFEIDLSRPIGGSGWHQPENSGGNWYPWTGPEARFALDLLLPYRHSYQCEMVMAPLRPHLFDDFSVAINDITVADTREWQGETLHLAFPVMRTIARSRPDFCRIAFRHKAVYSPADEGGADTRRLGFAVRSILFVRLPEDIAAEPVDGAEPLTPQEPVFADDDGGGDDAGGSPGLDMPGPAIEPVPPASAPAMAAPLAPTERARSPRKRRTGSGKSSR